MRAAGESESGNGVVVWKIPEIYMCLFSERPGKGVGEYCSTLLQGPLSQRELDLREGRACRPKWSGAFLFEVGGSIEDGPTGCAEQWVKGYPYEDAAAARGNGCAAVAFSGVPLPCHWRGDMEI